MTAVRRPSPATRRALALATGALLVAGGTAAPAGAAAKHAPCPTSGVTVATSTDPNVRVWRQGGTLKACTRRPGGRRVVRTLGPWSTATKVAVGGSSVAWTTRGGTPEAPEDRLAARDVRSGATWLEAAPAVPAGSASTPPADDAVLRLITDGRAVGWVTAQGVVAAAVRRFDPQVTTFYGEGVPGSVPFHVGRRFRLADAGPAQAAVVASRLAFSVGGDGDECGGTDDFRLDVPAVGDAPLRYFLYASRSSTRPDCGA